LIFYFFIVEGEGGEGMEFFYGPFIGNVEGRGGKGLIGFSGKVFFIVERVGSYFFIQINYGGRGWLKHTGLQQKGCTLIYLFFIVEGEGGGGMEFFYGPFIGNVEGRRGKGLIGFSGNVFFIMERVGG